MPPLHAMDWPAAAMGMMIFYTNVIAKLIHAGVARGILIRTQAWR